jgi:hypothetical protein
MFGNLVQWRAKLLRFPIRPAASGIKSSDYNSLNTATALLFPSHSEAFGLKPSSVGGNWHWKFLCQSGAYIITIGQPMPSPRIDEHR